MLRDNSWPNYRECIMEQYRNKNFNTVDLVKLIFMMFLFISISCQSKNGDDSEIIGEQFPGHVFETYLGKKLEILRSPAKQSIEEILKKNKKFISATQEIPRFAYTTDDIWGRYTLINNGKPQEIFFELRGPFEEVVVYVVVEGRVIERQRGGMFLKKSEHTQIIQHNHPVFKLNIPSGKSAIYFEENAVAPHFPIVTYLEEGFRQRQHSTNLQIYVLLGASIAFFIMAIITLLFITRKSAFFLLSGFTCFFLMISFVTGLFRSVEYLPMFSNEIFEWFTISIHKRWCFFLALYFLSLSLFSISHTGTKSFLGNKSSRILTIIALSGQVLMAITALFDTIIAMNLFSATFNITIGQAIYWSWKKYKKGMKEELLPVIGWSVYGVLTSMQLFYFLGLSDISFFAMSGTILGLFSLMSLLTATLVQKNRMHLIKSIDDLQRSVDELDKRNKTIKIFTNPQIYTEISLGLNPLAHQAKLAKTSIVFFDMRDFTSLSEKLRLQEVHELINTYTGKIIDYVYAEGGGVDKIIGDAVMARFSDPNICIKAIREIRLQLSELNRQRVKNGIRPVKFGTGISTGTVLEGNFGSSHRLDRTVIGNVVNHAARIEGMTRRFGVDVLLGHEFYEQLADAKDVRFIGLCYIKGYTTVIRLYEYFGHNRDDVKHVKRSIGLQLKSIWDSLEMSPNHETVASAIVAVENLINDCPEHTYLEGVVMDTTLPKQAQAFKNYIDAIAEK